VERALAFVERMAAASEKMGEAARLEAWGLFCHAVFVSNEFLWRM
jgi:hypothetical protein